jgi:hypothetical protein
MGDTRSPDETGRCCVDFPPGGPAGRAPSHHTQQARDPHSRHRHRPVRHPQPARPASAPPLPARRPAYLSREPGDLSRQPAYLSREPGDLSREPTPLSREPGHLSWEPGHLARESTSSAPRVNSPGSRARPPVPRADISGSGARSLGSRAKTPGPRDLFPAAEPGSGGKRATGPAIDSLDRRKALREAPETLRCSRGRARRSGVSLAGATGQFLAPESRSAIQQVFSFGQ